MKTSQKKQLAEALFMTGGYTQKELAERVDVSEKTMGKWCVDWKPILAASKSTNQEVILRIDKAILDIFKKAEDENRILTLADHDSLSKLTKSRDSMIQDLGLSVFIAVFQEYNGFLMIHDSELCRLNNQYQDKFINMKSSGGK